MLVTPQALWPVRRVAAWSRSRQSRSSQSMSVDVTSQRDRKLSIFAVARARSFQVPKKMSSGSIHAETVDGDSFKTRPLSRCRSFLVQSSSTGSFFGDEPTRTRRLRPSQHLSIDLTTSKDVDKLARNPETQQAPNVEPPAAKRWVELVAVGSSSSEVYHTLLNTGWVLLIFCCFSMSMLICLVFTGLYACDPVGVTVGLEGVREDNAFRDVFFFSVHAFFTNMVGDVEATSTWATSSSCLKASAALSSLPSSPVASSQSSHGRSGASPSPSGSSSKRRTPHHRARTVRSVALLISSAHTRHLRLVVHSHWHRPPGGYACLMFRLANERRTPILNARVTLSVLMRRTSVKGEPEFEHRLLELEKGEIPFFVGGLRSMHVINEQSPLWGMQSESELEIFGVTSINAVVQVGAALACMPPSCFSSPCELMFMSMCVVHI
jgi:hypothetical protein